MDSNMKIQPKLTNGVIKEDDCVNEFFTLIAEYCAGSKYQKLKSLVRDNEALKTELENKDRAWTTGAAEILKQKEVLAAQKTELITVQKENEKNRGQVAVLEKQLSEGAKRQKQEAEAFTVLQKQVKDLERTRDQLRQALEKIQGLEKDLQEKKQLLEELEEIKGYHATMTSYKTVGAKQLALSEITHAGFKWAKEFCFQELDPPVFHGDEWKGLKSNDMTEDFHKMLAATNTIPAKQVRYALGLQVLGKAIEEHILQPLYISDSESMSEFAMFLSSLGKKNPAHEVHIRSALLNALPEEQVKVGKQRAEIAAVQVMETIHGIVPKEKQKACNAELLRICHQALDVWKPLQSVEEQITVNFLWNFKDRDRWQTLQIPTPGAAQQGAKKEPPAKAASELKESDALEVWPLISTGGSLIHQGLLLTIDQFSDAVKLVEEEEQKHRLDRKKQRQANDGSSGVGGSGRRSSNAFLSTVRGVVSGGD